LQKDTEKGSVCGVSQTEPFSVSFCNGHLS